MWTENKHLKTVLFGCVYCMKRTIKLQYVLVEKLVIYLNLRCLKTKISYCAALQEVHGMH